MTRDSKYMEILTVVMPLDSLIYQLKLGLFMSTHAISSKEYPAPTMAVAVLPWYSDWYKCMKVQLHGKYLTASGNADQILHCWPS